MALLKLQLHDYWDVLSECNLIRSVKAAVRFQVLDDQYLQLRKSLKLLLYCFVGMELLCIMKGIHVICEPASPQTTIMEFREATIAVTISFVDPQHHITTLEFS